MKTNLRYFILTIVFFTLITGRMHAFTVSGIVIDAMTGKAVQFVMVSFSNIPREDSTYWSEPVYTDEEGRYSIDLPGETYFVFLYHENYESYEQANINVSSDLQLDFKLTPVVIIPNYENFVSGTVKDKVTGLPIPYSAVSLEPLSGEPFYMSSSTDENGNFKMSGINPGTYSVSVWQYGYNNYTDSSELIIEENTKITGLNILLEPLVQFDNIRIKVYNLTDAGVRTAVPNADVYLYSEYGKYYGLTGENGEYILDGVIGGSYELMSFAPGYAQKTIRVDINSSSLAFDVKLEKLMLGRITGKVFTSSDQKPLMGAVITAFSSESKYVPWSDYYAYSDSNGLYSMELPKGEYIIACSYISYYNFYYSATEYFDNALTMEDASDVTVGRDSVSGNIDFDLDLDLPDVVQTKITGKITSANTAKPVRYADLILNDLKGERNEYIKLEIDPDGNYTASAWMLKGQNELIFTAVSMGFEQQFYNGKNAWYNADIVKADISENNALIDNINFTLIPYDDIGNFSIQGRITDQENNPVQGAYAEAYNESGAAGLSVSDSAGIYNIVNLPVGKYIIAFSADGYLPVYYNNVMSWEDAKQVEVSDDITGIDAIVSKTAEPDFGGIISGTVTYNNKPITGARVVLSTLENTALAADITNQKGEFQLKGVNEADYIITVSSVNYQSYTSGIKFSMKESGTYIYNIMLNTTGTKDITAETKPSDYSLDYNYPNPFNPSTTIAFTIPEKSNVSIRVYDLLGNVVADLMDEEKEAGYYKIRFNAAAHSSGVYFCIMKAGPFTETKKLLLIK